MNWVLANNDTEKWIISSYYVNNTNSSKRSQSGRPGSFYGLIGVTAEVERRRVDQRDYSSSLARRTCCHSVWPDIVMVVRQRHQGHQDNEITSRPSHWTVGARPHARLPARTARRRPVRPGRACRLRHARLTFVKRMCRKERQDAATESVLLNARSPNSKQSTAVSPSVKTDQIRTSCSAGPTCRNHVEWP